jgi:hypothetical protein
VNYGDIGFAATPRLLANGKPVSGAAQPVTLDPTLAAVRARDLGTRATGERTELSAVTPLKAGDNVIEVLGAPFALDIDYLEVTPAP